MNIIMQIANVSIRSKDSGHTSNIFEIHQNKSSFSKFLISRYGLFCAHLPFLRLVCAHNIPV